MTPLLIVALALATGPPPPPTEREQAASALRLKLEKEVTLEFGEMPLQTVLTTLGEQQKIHIVLDRGNVPNGQDPSELPISVRLRNVRLRAGLHTLLNQYNLSYAVLGDSILVSTRDHAYQMQVRQPVTIHADARPLRETLERLRRETATNLLLDPALGDKADKLASLHVEDVPLETAVRLMAELAGLKPVRMDNLLFVTSDERANKLDGTGSPPPTNTPTMTGR